jgi:UDP-N-acetylmuramoyl-tripeptide--D-alanyl-D-alanine ligase
MAPAAHRGEVLRLGERVTVVDDSYNSNPVAVASALEALALAGSARRVAFLGDMLELGAEARRLHEELGESLPRRADVVVGVGPLGRGFVDGARRGGAPAAALHAFPDAPSAAASAVEIVRPGDAVLVKGSRGVRMEKVVDALVARFGRVEA